MVLSGFFYCFVPGESRLWHKMGPPGQHVDFSHPKKNQKNTNCIAKIDQWPSGLHLGRAAIFTLAEIKTPSGRKQRCSVSAASRRVCWSSGFFSSAEEKQTNVKQSVCSSHELKIAETEKAQNSPCKLAGTQKYCWLQKRRKRVIRQKIIFGAIKKWQKTVLVWIQYLFFLNRQNK